MNHLKKFNESNDSTDRYTDEEWDELERESDDILDVDKSNAKLKEELLANIEKLSNIIKNNTPRPKENKVEMDLEMILLEVSENIDNCLNLWDVNYYN